VRAKIIDIRKRYARGVPVEILSGSSVRTAPECRYFEECGGCHYQHLQPGYVSERKVEHVRDVLQRIGRDDSAVSSIHVPARTWNYRNRVTYHRSGGNAGYVSWKDSSVIDVNECPIAQKELNDLWRHVREITAPISSDDLPFVVLRRTSSGELATLLGASTATTLNAVAGEWDRDDPLFGSLIRRGAVSAFGGSIQVLKGKERLTEIVGGIRYSVRPDLFFQVNPEITEKIVERVVSWGDDVKPSRILDIYCGAGLFTLALAKRGYPSHGVEVSHEAILCAKESARENGLESVATFRTGKADRIVQRLIREGERFDAAVVDPPRRGLHPFILENLTKLGIRNLLYVSCSPATFARDVRQLKTLGYRLDWVQPYDMFPQTYHVETVAGFSVLERA
jgi:23S rRNA (uracil1939-C5)-methyltransferase